MKKKNSLVWEREIPLYFVFHLALWALPKIGKPIQVVGKIYKLKKNIFTCFQATCKIIFASNLHHLNVLLMLNLKLMIAAQKVKAFS